MKTGDRVNQVRFSILKKTKTNVVNYPVHSVPLFIMKMFKYTPRFNNYSHLTILALSICDFFSLWISWNYKHHAISPLNIQFTSPNKKDVYSHAHILWNLTELTVIPPNHLITNQYSDFPSFLKTLLHLFSLQIRTIHCIHAHI